MTDSTSDKHSASFLLTQTIEEIRSSCWIGFLGQCGTGGRVAEEKGDLERDPKIESAGAVADVIGAGLPYICWMISPSPLALMT